MAAGTEAATNANKKVVLQSFAPFTNCVVEMNNTQVDDAHDIDEVMPLYILLDYSDIHFIISENSG